MMIKLAFLLASAAIVFLPGASPATAAPAKVWVSKDGTDNASCGSATLPCRSFQFAHDKADAGSEIGVLTPGDYGGTFGQLSISKSISIVNDGTGEADILTGLSGNNSVVIGGGVGAVVSLRGLTVDGQGIGSIGIRIFGPSVHIQNCVIRNFERVAGFGIEFHSSSRQLFVSDTLIYNNGTFNSGGIWIVPETSSSANVVLDRVRLENNVIGLLVDGTASTGSGAHVILRDSVVSGNAGDGIIALSAPGKAAAFLVVERTSSVNNAGNGIRADGPRATILLSDSTIARNGAGITTVNGGQLLSYGNNTNNNNIGPEGAATGFLGLF